MSYQDQTKQGSQQPPDPQPQAPQHSAVEPVAATAQSEPAVAAVQEQARAAEPAVAEQQATELAQAQADDQAHHDQRG
jgi:hypothetical protein